MHSNFFGTSAAMRKEESFITSRASRGFRDCSMIRPAWEPRWCRRTRLQTKTNIWKGPSTQRIYYRSLVGVLPAEQTAQAAHSKSPEDCVSTKKSTVVSLGFDLHFS